MRLNVLFFHKGRDTTFKYLHITNTVSQSLRTFSTDVYNVIFRIILINLFKTYSKSFRCDTYSCLIGPIIEHLIAILETHSSELYFGKRIILAQTYQLKGLILAFQSHWDFGFETFCIRLDNYFIAQVSSIKFRGNISPMINFGCRVPEK